MEFRLLGQMEARAEGLEIALGPKKQRAVLAVLILHCNEMVPAERLVENVWGDKQPRTAVHAIHNYVSALRKAFAAVTDEPVIETSSSGYVLRIEPGAIDIVRFERLVAEGQHALRNDEPREAVRLFQQALELWRGVPLAEFPYAEFAQAEVRKLEETRIAALGSLYAAEIAAGNHRDVIAPLQKLTRQHEFEETFRAHLMTALYLSGRQTDALRQYREYADLLAEETGIDPSPQLQELEDRILRQDPALTDLARRPVPAPRGEVEDWLPTGEQPDDFFGSAGMLLLAEEEAPRVGLLFLGGADRGFNELGIAGLKRAQGRLEIEKVEVPIARAGTDWEIRRASRAVGAGLLIVMGHIFQRYLPEVTEDFPGLTYVSIDQATDAPGVASFWFKEQEGSFLVGAAAALKTVSNTLGFLGGAPIPVIDRFQAGFVAGARHVSPGIEIVTDYVAEGYVGLDAFMSPSLGYRKGRAIFEDGADIVMHAAGASGLGVFEAARVTDGGRGRHWAIGADSDQFLNVRSDLRPHVLTSMVKRSDTVVFDVIQSWVNDELVRGSDHVYGLADRAVGYSTSGGFIDDITGQLDEFAAQIIAGEIQVPNHP